MTQVIIQQLEGIDPNAPIFKDIDTTTDKCPRYSTSEVAKFFFGRSPHWMRWRERKGHFVLNGTPVEPERTATGSRTYTLADVERLAHALASNHAIDARQLAMTLRAVQVQGMIHNLL